MRTRPQTLAALADTPVGLAAFLVDQNDANLALVSRVFAGQKEGISRVAVSLFPVSNATTCPARCGV